MNDSSNELLAVGFWLAFAGVMCLGSAAFGKAHEWLHRRHQRKADAYIKRIIEMD